MFSPCLQGQKPLRIAVRRVGAAIEPPSGACQPSLALTWMPLGDEPHPSHPTKHPQETIVFVRFGGVLVAFAGFWNILEHVGTNNWWCFSCGILGQRVLERMHFRIGPGFNGFVRHGLLLCHQRAHFCDGRWILKGGD